MSDGINEPAAIPVLTSAEPGPAPRPAAGRRGVVLLAIGVVVGLALGALLTLGVTSTYTLLTHTLPETRESVQVFNELNELRQELNQMNEVKKLKEQEKEDAFRAEAMRQALGAVASAVRAPDSGTPAAPPAQKQAGGAETPPAAKPEAPPVAKSQDPFADIDEEIERLEKTQKVLNTILDVFTRKGKEGAKDR
jgi:hypothetical protein